MLASGIKSISGEGHVNAFQRFWYSYNWLDDVDRMFIDCSTDKGRAIMQCVKEKQDHEKKSKLQIGTILFVPPIFIVALVSGMIGTKQGFWELYFIILAIYLMGCVVNHSFLSRKPNYCYKHKTDLLCGLCMEEMRQASIERDKAVQQRP